MKLWRGAGAGVLVFVRYTVERPGASVAINRRGSATRSGRWIVAKHRVVTEIGSSIDFGGLFGACAFRRSKAGPLGSGRLSEKKRNKRDQKRKDPLPRPVLMHCLPLDFPTLTAGFCISLEHRYVTRKNERSWID